MRVETERLVLRGAQREFIQQEVDWLNDAEIVKYSEQRHKRHTWTTQRDYINSFRWPDLLMEIHVKESEPFDVPPDVTLRNAQWFIGTFTVYVDQANRSADMGILIGDRRSWGRGYATEAWRAMIKFVFNMMPPVEMVTGGCMIHNTGMLKVMKNCDMVPAGVIADRFCYDGHRAAAAFYALRRACE